MIQLVKKRERTIPKLHVDYLMNYVVFNAESFVEEFWKNFQ